VTSTRRILRLGVASGLLAGDLLGAADKSGMAKAIEQSRNLLDQALQLYPGTAVAVAVGDRIVWSTAYGFSDVDRQRPVSRATQFRIYEVAMPLTAAAMAKLAEQGRVDVDAPLRRYLPELPEATPAVTLRALGGHLAGVRDLAEGEEVAAPCGAARSTARALPPRLFVRPPGLGFSVSRYGYLLLSAALESATGRSFPELLNETVSGPAGMGSTMIDDPRRFLPGRTLFYERGWFGLLRAARAVEPGCRWGAGGLLSTTEDLVRFGASLLRGELLRRETRELLFVPQRTRAGAQTGYGLGWHVENDSRGRRYLWHGGRGIGGRAAIVLVPHARLVAVMLSNIEGERLDEHARRIASFFLAAEEDSGGPPDVLRAFSPSRPFPIFADRAMPAPGE